MEAKVSHDALGTHIDWSHDGITAKMIDWFWINMDKGFMLWHPEQHEALDWPVPPVNGNPIGAIHNAPQTWNDGKRQNLYIRFDPIESLTPEIRDVIIYQHVIVTAGLGFDMEAMKKGDPMGYRIHQWQATDFGVVGKSSAIPTRRKETVEEGKVWAAHCIQEIGNWANFLPELYGLYRVITDPRRNPYADLSVVGRGRDAHYKYIKDEPAPIAASG